MLLSHINGVAVLEQLSIKSLRNLETVSLKGLGQVNLFVGDNGAGKTSLLEAIHVLATGRSFRHTQIRPVVQHGSDGLLVSALWRDERGFQHRSGIERSLEGRVRIRCDGERVATAAELASLLPVQVLNAEGFSLIEGAPSLRRQFIDWGVFHVEHRFFSAWSAAQRALRQRNALLKHGRIDRSALALWTRSYAENGEVLAGLRQAHFVRLSTAFHWALERLAPGLKDLSLDLNRGWTGEDALADTLAADEETDLRRGFTRSGPHRADLMLRADRRSAQDVLSRGQIKIVAAALKLAQGLMLKESSGRHCLYLIDDLAAELDGAHRQRLCKALFELGAQVFVTALDRSDVEDCWPADEHAPVVMFHVEHGAVSTIPQHG